MLGGSDAGAHLDRMCGSNTAFLDDCAVAKLPGRKGGAHDDRAAGPRLFGLRRPRPVGRRASRPPTSSSSDPDTVSSEPAAWCTTFPATRLLFAGSNRVVRVLVNGTETVARRCSHRAPGSLLRLGRDTASVIPASAGSSLPAPVTPDPPPSRPRSSKTRSPRWCGHRGVDRRGARGPAEPASGGDGNGSIPTGGADLTGPPEPCSGPDIAPPLAARGHRGARLRLLGGHRLAHTYVVQTFYIPTGSMEAHLAGGRPHLGQQAQPTLHGVHRGDIVVFNRPKTENCGGRGQRSGQAGDRPSRRDHLDLRRLRRHQWQAPQRELAAAVAPRHHRRGPGGQPGRRQGALGALQDPGQRLLRHGQPDGLVRQPLCGSRSGQPDRRQGQLRVWPLSSLGTCSGGGGGGGGGPQESGPGTPDRAPAGVPWPVLHEESPVHQVRSAGSDRRAGHRKRQMPLREPKACPSHEGDFVPDIRRSLRMAFAGNRASVWARRPARRTPGPKVPRRGRKRHRRPHARPRRDVAFTTRLRRASLGLPGNDYALAVDLWPETGTLPGRATDSGQVPTVSVTSAPAGEPRRDGRQWRVACIGSTRRRRVDRLHRDRRRLTAGARCRR